MFFLNSFVQFKKFSGSRDAQQSADAPGLYPPYLTMIPWVDAGGQSEILSA